MIKNIVIVTYDEDWYQCKTLLNSIDFWLEDCNIVLVDNNPEPHINHFMINNRLKIVPWSDVVSKRVTAPVDLDYGWVTQQLIKLHAHKYFTDQYVVLDSKDVILDSLTEWPVDTFAIKPNEQHNFYEFYKQVCGKFNRDELPVLPPQTPYIFNVEWVRELIEHFDDFDQWFASFAYPSEYVLYDLWLEMRSLSQHSTLHYYVPQPLLQIYNKQTLLDYQTGTKRYKMATVLKDFWRPNFHLINR